MDPVISKVSDFIPLVSPGISYLPPLWCVSFWCPNITLSVFPTPIKYEYKDAVSLIAFSSTNLTLLRISKLLTSIEVWALISSVIST